MTILLTGGSGFIGSHLVQRLLHEGHFVINVDNFDDFYDYRIKINNTLESVNLPVWNVFTNKESDIQRLAEQTAAANYQLFHKDIRERESMRNIFEQKQIDMVVHLAALAGVRPSIERPLDYEAVNIRGTMNLWELCKDFNIKKFICASSSSVYGNNQKVPFAENDAVDHPISPYAATKRAAEILGHVYHQLYDIDMLQLRFFTVYGPRQRPDLAIHKFTKFIFENREIPFYGDGTTARDYTYIDDIVDGIMRSINFLQNTQKIYEIINLGESEVITLQEMVQTIEENLQKTAVKNVMPMQPGDVYKTNADISKARKLIGYSPGTNFQNGIKNFVEWFLAKTPQPESLN